MTNCIHGRSVTSTCTDCSRTGYGSDDPEPARYVPNGKPLTDYEREILTILVEECCEVGQAATKLLRFGKENRPESGVSNTRELGLEIGDLRHMIGLLLWVSLVDDLDVEDGRERKAKRLAIYMQSRP